LIFGNTGSRKNSSGVSINQCGPESL